MSLFAILPPLPMNERIVVGLLGTLFAGLLNLVYRNASPRLWQFALALVISPLIVSQVSPSLADAGWRTFYVFWGAVVGIVVIRGHRSPGPIPRFVRRSIVVFVAFVVLSQFVPFAVERWFIERSLHDYQFNGAVVFVQQKILAICAFALFAIMFAASILDRFIYARLSP